MWSLMSYSKKRLFSSRYPRQLPITPEVDLREHSQGQAEQCRIQKCKSYFYRFHWEDWSVVWKSFLAHPSRKGIESMTEVLKTVSQQTTRFQIFFFYHKTVVLFLWGLFLWVRLTKVSWTNLFYSRWFTTLYHNHNKLPRNNHNNLFCPMCGKQKSKINVRSCTLRDDLLMNGCSSWGMWWCCLQKNNTVTHVVPTVELGLALAYCVYH